VAVEAKYVMADSASEEGAAAECARLAAGRVHKILRLFSGLAA
jgi:hypothetical protein